MKLRASCFVAALAALSAVGASAEAAPRPNILFIIMDDWGWRDAGVYGSTWVKTPTFDRIAQEGALFRNAFTSNPKCSPSRASILTGRNGWQLEQGNVHFGSFPAKFATYPGVLKEAGYAVGFTGKGWGPGNFEVSGLSQNPAGHEFSGLKLAPPTSGISPIDYARNFERFLSQRKPGQPFCFWLGLREPHRPYERGSGVKMGLDPKTVAVPPYLPDGDVVRGDLLDYAIEVEWADTQAGKAIAALQAAGELDHTLVVMTSDNGMPFPRVKGQIFDDDHHLPLAMRWSGVIKPGRVVEDFVNFRDFATTFLAVAGLAPPASMTGRSLVPLLRSGKSGWIDFGRSVMLVNKERHDLGRPGDAGYPVRAIRTREWLYVRNYAPDRWPAGNPETDYPNCDPGPTKDWIIHHKDKYYDWAFGLRPAESLYRIDSDSDCLSDLAGDPQYAGTLKDLRGRMEAILREEGDPRLFGRGDVFDTYPYYGDRGHAYDTWLRSQSKEPAPAPNEAGKPGGTSPALEWPPGHKSGAADPL